MKKTLLFQSRGLIIGFVGLMMVLLMTACSGFAGVASTNGNSLAITGKVTAVDAQHGTVSLNVNGQTYTISGLSSSQVAALQGQVGKTYKISATQNSNGTYTINVNNNAITLETNPSATPGVETETPNNNETPTTSGTGNIQFTGKVQQVNGNAITVALPDGQSLTMNIVSGQTDLSDFNNAAPAVNQIVKAEANANSDGSFSATKISMADSGDLQKQNIVKYQGITTSAVGSDNMLHFTVGNHSYSYAINASTELKDFNSNAQSIGNNQAVKVEVQFQGATGTVLSVGNPNS
ncbi:MAG TPA: DUF5666 domain-containing protein [Ktedonobacteraceae bacterium]|nr:DUF5666 domain-containing protein [Ktedonobacteraceae bacterium]